jgi:hypothetical protein
VEGGEAVTGAEMIAAERRRQVEAEGWTLAHDDQHDKGEMALAAACYAATDHLERRPGHVTGETGVAPALWPWEQGWWKPYAADRADEEIRRLTKAGALIAAEIDRLNRATSPQQSVPDTGEGATDCERCKGEGEISVSHSAYCNCIMTAHCRGKGGKDGKLCRLRRFGSGDEGSPGVAGPPQVKTRCPDCSGSGKKPPDPPGEVLGREGDDRG